MRENRQADRSSAIIKVNYSSRGALKMDYAQNISRGGLFLATESTFSIGDSVELQLNSHGLVEPISLPGIVRWVGKRGTPPIQGIGIQFSFKSDDEQAKIDAMMNALDDSSALSEQTTVYILDPNDYASKLYADGLQKMAQRQASKIKGQLVIERFTDAKAVRQRMKVKPCDVLITELKAPDLDGVALVRALRAEKGDDLPIFAISKAFPGDRQAALNAGASAFLNKPLQQRTLFNTLLLCLKQDQQ